MAGIGEASGFAVTLASVVENEVTVLEMVPGKGLFEFTIRPGARLGYLSSAHGLVTLAYGPPEALEAELARDGAGPVFKTAERVRKTLQEIRKNGWARSVDGVQPGFGALAAPVFDHRGALRASIAIVGASRDLTSASAPAQEAMIKKASADASQLLGWRGGAF
jgi:DNA-binding IclR family transcriptional regulator